MNQEARSRTRKVQRPRLMAIGMAAVAAVMTMTACEPAYDTYVGDGYSRGIITRDGNDDYSVAIRSDGFTVRAKAGNTGGNFRQAIISDAAPVSVDQESCVTWHGAAAGITQPGVVLRAKNESSGTKLIMVTGNIMYGWRAGVNVHEMDTNTTEAVPYRMIAQFSSSAVGDYTGNHPLPWRYCARAEGNRITYKAWSTRNPEPAWNSPKTCIHPATTMPDGSLCEVGVTTVSNDFVYAGKPGTYIGHLRPGQSSTFTGQSYEVITGTPGDDWWRNTQNWAAEHGYNVTMDAGLGSGVQARNISQNPKVVEAARLATQGQPFSAMAGLANDPAGRRAEGRRIFGTILGRNGGNLANGTRPTDYVKSVVASKEFQGGKSDSDFVKLLYTRVLGRTKPPTDVSFWVNKLKNGTSRAEVGRQIYTSAESQNRIVNLAARDVWGRGPTSAERAALVKDLKTHDYDSTMLRALMASRLAPGYR